MWGEPLILDPVKLLASGPTLVNQHDRSRHQDRGWSPRWGEPKRGEVGLTGSGWSPGVGVNR